MYERQSNENGSEAKTYYRTFLTSKVISITVNTFIPLGDKMVNHILEKACGLSTEPLLYPATRLRPMQTDVHECLSSGLQKCENHMGRDLGCRGDVEALPNQISVAYSSQSWQCG
jgi:hypothetical protein